MQIIQYLPTYLMTLSHWSLSSQPWLGFFLLIAAPFPALSIMTTILDKTDEKLLRRHGHFKQSNYLPVLESGNSMSLRLQYIAVGVNGLKLFICTLFLLSNIVFFHIYIVDQSTHALQCLPFFCGGERAFGVSLHHLNNLH